MKRITTVLLVFVAVVGCLTAPAAAQAETPTPTPDGDEAQTIEHQLGNSDVLEVDWTDRTAHITIEADSRARVAITDAGAIDNLGSGGSERIGFETYTIPPGETREIQFTTASDPVITIQEGGEMVAASGDRQVLDIITGAPTVALVQWAAVSGISGTLLSTGLSVGLLKRRHQNSYRELTNDERHRIERDPVDGVVGRAKRFLADHYVAIALAVVSGVYALLMAFGVVRGPLAFWGDLADAHRVIIAGTAATTVVALPPAFALVSRVWSPDVEFVLDIDVDDIIQSARGVEPEDGGFAIYSGPPERIRQMDLRNADTDAGKSKAETPGGRAVVVRNMDPTDNEADGTWPGLADDRELVADQAKIRDNRNRLLDSAELGKNLLREISGISIASDIASTRAVDKAVRSALSTDSGAIDDILDEAAEGTRWEDYYTPGEAAEDDENADHANESPDERADITNDDDTTEDST
ncbi:uncharacterized protein NP_5344A [Natronomonas pharaonis DSM 2160]|uniref:Uncharacterized protein n=1 Tax=Natronomonas pharaonis (strain ATCC 35678 / DSM 2160 / CIP 103997 / JCM 8858 / NBRC 14720 / NCIMB 2260 / Gabara) TaxID=348780 RepID=A0A1U7EZN9_NATPD|nr:hypothetical protein [Natronomonas pharaonis]CAI50763.1 uncharacterized protein NP_5344A [Natronomonas pharaonis DSM 2160]